MMMKFALGLASLSCVVGCAGSISGEIDGESVPGFSSAAFGLATQGDAGVAIGVALGGDSCKTGSELFQQSVDGRDDSPEKRAEDGADFINENIPQGTWFLSTSFSATDKDDIESGSIDLEDPDSGVFFSLSVCFQDDEAEADGEVLDSGADCYSAAEGDLDVELDDDQTRLTIKGEKIEMHDEDGDDQGDVDINVTYSRCDDLDDAVDDLIGVQVDG